jgi:hypothetical protein
MELVNAYKLIAKELDMQQTEKPVPDAPTNLNWSVDRKDVPTVLEISLAHKTAQEVDLETVELLEV